MSFATPGLVLFRLTPYFAFLDRVLPSGPMNTSNHTPSSTPANTPIIDSQLLELVKRLKQEIARHVVGQNHLVERLLVALLADGHVLLEGVPGLAKTRLLSVLTAAIQAHMQRIQFTADLLPSDLIGTEIYRANSGNFEVRKGPIFTNLLLADEINRAPAKVQSALLQAMQERQATIGEETFELPDPFMVLATQNPIEQEGTYTLPEAQLDRFLLKLRVSYPSFDEEVAILKMPPSEQSRSLAITPILGLPELRMLRQAAANVFVDSRIDRYIVSLVQASRQAATYGLQGMVDWGASPRASLALKNCTRALALLHGRNFVTPEDVKELAPDVLRHRVVMSFEGEAKGITSDEVVKILCKSVTIP